MKVGDYVRTKEGNIYKIAKLGYNNETFWSDTNDGWFAMYKSSPKIIDLIEIGDYVNYEQVNGGYVLNKKKDSIDTWAILPNSLKNEDIKSVITREQMKSIEYKVKE